MSLLTPTTKRIELPDGSWVIVKKLTNKETRQHSHHIDAATAKGDVQSGGWLDLQADFVKLVVIEWGGSGLEDEPLTPENVDALPHPYLQFIAIEAQAFNAPLSDAEKKRLTASSTGS